MKVSVAVSREAVSHRGVAWKKGVHAMESKLSPWSLMKSDPMMISEVSLGTT